VDPITLELWDYLAKNPTAKQKRGAGLARIQELIIKGEARGVAKYSRRHVEKTGWDLNEHLAYFVHNVRSENTHRRGGVFFQKNLPENIMDTAIWTLKNILIQMHSPSQINKPSGGKAIFGETLPDANDLLIQPTLEDYERISMHEKWLDAQEYQFDNHEEACRNLGIVDKANPRIKGMQRGQELKFWQPVCINRVAEIMRLDLLRGAIIADVVGVGKTWEAVAFLLHVTEQDKTEPPEGRPVIIIVPPHLIDQWMDEIMSITEEFQVLLYYGDARRQVGSYIKDKLTKKHEIFKGGLESARTIVVTSYQTWEARHGPQAVKAWCGSKKKPYNPANPHMPPDFPGNLNGRFGVAVFDEAHMLRNRESGISFACTWLRAGFRILLTATPFYN
ncbi:P-loop containing nucleoside triphosphate hydrolase protein, partial [Aspergillus heteromorphus CBS 117.55]